MAFAERVIRALTTGCGNIRGKRLLRWPGRRQLMLVVSVVDDLTNSVFEVCLFCLL